MSADDYFVRAIFHYVPSNGLLWTTYHLFFVAGVCSLVATLRYSPRAWYMYLVSFAAFLEQIGYGTRAATVIHKSVNWYILSTLCLVLPAIPLAAVNYTVTGKLLQSSETRVWRWLKPQYLGRVFLAGDVLCLLVQCAGAAPITSPDPDQQYLGKIINVLGIVLQLALFALYTTVLALVRASERFAEVRSVRNFRPIFAGLCGTIACLWVRNVFRLAEFVSYFSPEGGGVNSQEWVLYVFDALPILVSLTLYTVYHFGLLLRPASTVEPCAAAPAHSAAAPSSTKAVELVARAPEDRQGPSDTSGAGPATSPIHSTRLEAV